MRARIARFGALTVAAAILALIWLLIERNAGTSLTGSFARVELEFENQLVFQPESDGLSQWVSALDISDAHELSIEPCPFGAAQCRVIRRFGSIHAVVAASDTKAQLSFLSLARVHRADASAAHCSAKLELEVPQERAGTFDIGAGEIGADCEATLEVTIFERGVDSARDSLLTMTLTDGIMEGHPDERKVQLTCELGAGECRHTLRAVLVPSTTKVSYVLREARDAVLLRGGQTAAPELMSLGGVLAPRAPDDASVACCRDLAGDHLNFREPRLQRLVLRGSSSTLQASLDKYQWVSCTFPWKDFLIRFSGILGLPTLLELRACRGKRWRRRARLTPSAPAPQEANPREP